MNRTVRTVSGLWINSLALITLLFFVLCLSGCPNTIGSFFGEDFHLTKSYQIYPDDDIGDRSIEELEWVVTTIIETQRYDCEYLSEFRIVQPSLWHYCPRVGLEDPLEVQYLVGDSEIELHLRGPESRTRALNAAAEALVASFQAANLRYDTL